MYSIVCVLVSVGIASKGKTILSETVGTQKKYIYKGKEDFVIYYRFTLNYLYFVVGIAIMENYVLFNDSWLVLELYVLDTWMMLQVGKMVTVRIDGL